MLSLAGVDARPDQHVDGVSFIPALKGQKSTRPPMFWYKWMARPDSTGDTRALSLIDGNFKLISWIDEDLTELFDIASAPGEQNNIAEKFPEKTKAMLAKIEQLEAEAGNLREAGKKMLQRRIERKKKQQRGKAKPSEEPVGS
jgi:arylsulfatase A-like enzyme